MVWPSVFVGQRKDGGRALWWVLRVLPEGMGHYWQRGRCMKDYVDIWRIMWPAILAKVPIWFFCQNNDSVHLGLSRQNCHDNRGPVVAPLKDQTLSLLRMYCMESALLWTNWATICHRQLSIPQETRQPSFTIVYFEHVKKTKKTGHFLKAMVCSLPKGG